MTHKEYLSRQIDLDDRDLKTADRIVAVGCLVATVAWIGLLAHWTGVL